MDALGKRFVAVLLKSKDLGLLSKYSLDASDLHSDAKHALVWSLDYFREYSAWPAVESIAESIGVEIPDEEAPAEYVAELLRNRSLAKRIEKTTEFVIKCLEDRRPDEALDTMTRAVMALRSRTKVELPVSFRDSGDDRIRKYLELKEHSGLLGMPTPWPRLNTNIQGWCDGTLNVITAMMNTGKSWFLSYCADHSLSLGFKVLFITLEMDIPRIQRRVDAIRYKIPIGRLRSCDMDIELEESWKSRVLADKSGDGDIIFADKKLVRTVSDVTLLVQEYKPDIVYIDGGYRFSVPGGGNAGEWANTVTIVSDLQLAAEITNIPWVVTTQQGDANETGKRSSGDKKMHAWGVRYGKEWVINPDNVIGLYADDDLRALKTLELHQLKTRDATGDMMHAEIPISWDLAKMDFSEIEGLGMSDEVSDMSIFGTHEVRIVDE